MHICMGTQTYECTCPQMLEEDAGYPGVGVTSRCGPPEDVGSGATWACGASSVSAAITPSC